MTIRHVRSDIHGSPLNLTPAESAHLICTFGGSLRSPNYLNTSYVPKLIFRDLKHIWNVLLAVFFGRLYIQLLPLYLVGKSIRFVILITRSNLKAHNWCYKLFFSLVLRLRPMYPTARPNLSAMMAAPENPPAESRFKVKPCGIRPDTSPPLIFNWLVWPL